MAHSGGKWLAVSKLGGSPRVRRDLLRLLPSRTSTAERQPVGWPGGCHPYADARQHCDV